MYEDIRYTLGNLISHVVSLEQYIEHGGPEALENAPHLVRGAQGVINDTREFLHEHDFHKQRAWQQFGGVAFAECPAVMFAPVGSWHQTLDRIQARITFLGKRVRQRMI